MFRENFCYCSHFARSLVYYFCSSIRQYNIMTCIIPPKRYNIVYACLEVFLIGRTNFLTLHFFFCFLGEHSAAIYKNSENSQTSGGAEPVSNQFNLVFIISMVYILFLCQQSTSLELKKAALIQSSRNQQAQS